MQLHAGAMRILVHTTAAACAAQVAGRAERIKMQRLCDDAAADADAGDMLGEMRKMRYAGDYSEYAILERVGDRQTDKIVALKNDIYRTVVFLCSGVLSLGGINPLTRYFTKEWDETRCPAKLCAVVRRLRTDIRGVVTGMDMWGLLRAQEHLYARDLKECIQVLEDIATERKVLAEGDTGALAEGDAGALDEQARQHEESSMAHLKTYRSLVHGAYVALLMREEGPTALEADVPTALKALLRLTRSRSRHERFLAQELKAAAELRARLCVSLLDARMRQLVLLYAAGCLRDDMESDHYLESTGLTIPIQRAYALAGAVGDSTAALYQTRDMGLYDDFTGADAGEFLHCCTEEVVGWAKAIALEGFRKYAREANAALYDRYFGTRCSSVNAHVAVLQQLAKDCGAPWPRVKSTARSTFAVNSTFSGYILVRTAQAAAKALRLAQKLSGGEE